jgi:dCMP deaminase
MPNLVTPSPNKNNRLTWPEYACFLAIAATSRSEDPHTHVGACILNENHEVVSTGYNGLKKGMEIEPWMYDEENRVLKAKLFIHAETNAFRHVNTKSRPFLLASTWSPCKSCAMQIAGNNIQEVYFINTYMKDQEYVDIFKFYKIRYAMMSDESLYRIRRQFNKQFLTAFELRKKAT